MTKEQLIDFTKIAIQGNRLTDDSVIAVNDNLISMYIGIAWNTTIESLIARNPMTYLSVLGDYTITETVTGEIDCGQVILQTKAKPLSLLHQEGVRSVHPVSNPKRRLIYRNVMSSILMDDIDEALGVSNEDGTYSFTPEAIVLSTPIKTSKWVVTMIPSFDSIPYEQEIAIPYEGAKALIDLVKDTYFSTKQPDTINDGR